MSASLIVDLRGRGGNYVEIANTLEVLRADRATNRRPIVALVDRQSRSGKNILAYEIKPVQPDVLVERAGPFAAGRDFILDAGVQEAVKLLNATR